MSTTSNAASTLITPIAALLLLTPVEYGRFSLVYLVYALGTSTAMSIICEPWARQHGHESTALRGAYSFMAVGLAAATAVVTVLVAALAGLHLEELALSGVAVAAAVIRFACRYEHLASGRIRRVVVSDAAGAAVTAAVYVVGLNLWANSQFTVLAGWAAGSLVAASCTFFAPNLRFSHLRSWSRQFSADIRILWRDSLITDAAAIGTPYLMAPLLGIASFGVYRALANITAPVRLMIAGVRPFLARVGPTRALSSRTAASWGALALTIGLTVYALMSGLHNSDYEIGSLSAISAYAIPCGVVTASITVTQFYVALARLFSTPATLLRVRLFHAVMLGVLPLSGAALFGLTGAIWAYTAASAVGAVAWYIGATRFGRARPSGT